MDGADEAESRRFLTNVSSLGSKMAGGVLGAAASARLHIPIAGAIVSPFIAFQLEKAGKLIINSTLAPRQEQRVAAAYVIAFQKITKRIEAGDMPRSDAFFKEDETGHSDAAEITEATLAAARNAAEERKVPYISNLLASIVYDELIDRSTAHFLVSTAERLSYRSYAILSIIGSGELRSGQQSTEKSEHAPAIVESVLSETFSLMSNAIIHAKNGPTDTTLNAVLGAGDIKASELYLSDLGYLLYKTMELNTMLPGDIERVRLENILRHAVNFGPTSISVDDG